jgi:nitrogen-specific signal transduction histidine kinase
LIHSKESADLDGNDPLTPVLDAIPLVVLLIDRSLKIRWVNKRGESLFGRPRNCLIGQPIRPLESGLWTWSQGPTFDETLRALFLGGDPISEDERRCNIRVDGKKTEYGLKVNASLIAFGGDPMALMALENVTPTNPSENKNTETEKLSLAIQMARATTHALNQPLSVVTGNLDLLMNRGEFDGPLKDRIERISRSADRVAEFVRLLQGILRSPGECDTLRAGKIDSAKASMIV